MKQTFGVGLLILALVGCAPTMRNANDTTGVPLKAGEVWVLKTFDENTSKTQEVELKILNDSRPAKTATGQPGTFIVGSKSISFANTPTNVEWFETIINGQYYLLVAGQFGRSNYLSIDIGRQRTLNNQLGCVFNGWEYGDTLIRGVFTSLIPNTDGRTFQREQIGECFLTRKP
jgi:hypothetical protein